MLLYPFQNLSLELASSRYDLTSFLLWGLGVALFFWRGRLLIRATVAVVGLGALQILVFQFLGIPPLHRFISGLFWFGGMVVILLAGDRIKYQRGLVVLGVWATTGLSALYILFERYHYGLSRPKAWFVEPSYAGLALYAVAAGALGVVLLSKVSLGQRLLLSAFVVLLLWAAVLTYSMHLVTFILISLLLLLYRYIRLSTVISANRLIAAATLVIFIGLGLSLLREVEHFRSRMDVTTVPSNVSLISWLRGFDQMKAALEMSPVLGVGLGGTGEFDFYSPWNGRLGQLGLADLNRRDAYSLGFRLIIEIGPFIFGTILIYILVRLWRTHKWTDAKHLREPDRLFLVLFSLTVMLGALIKEPLYAQSYLYLAVFLFASETSVGVVRRLPATANGHRDYVHLEHRWHSRPARGQRGWVSRS